MNKKAWERRRLVALLALSTIGAVACGSGKEDGGTTELGELRLPLSTQGASGVEYRLRNATFEITSYCYDWYCGYGGYAGDGGETKEAPIMVSSEDDPTASSISLSLEEGEYQVRLLPGWHMEQITNEGAETVEATLLSPTSLSVWINRDSTRWAEFQFGIGSKEIWLNGQLNIEIEVHENPDDYYGGYAGAPGAGGEAGAGG